MKDLEILRKANRIDLHAVETNCELVERVITVNFDTAIKEVVDLLCGEILERVKIKLTDGVHLIQICI